MRNPAIKILPTRTLNESKIAYYNNWNNFFAQNYNNNYKLYSNNCIDDEIQTTTCLGNNRSAKYNIPPACSIHQRPRINTIAPRDQFQQFQISDYWRLFATIHQYSPLFALFVLFAIRYSRLFATIRDYSRLFATIRCSLFAIRDYSLFAIRVFQTPERKDADLRLNRKEHI